MRRIKVSNSVTLDGVMQAPGRPDEDTRGGFEHGGWAGPYFDPVMIEAAGDEMADGAAFLFGRRTYDDFAKTWPHMSPDNPFTRVLNEGRKYVVSNTLKEPLGWANSSVLRGDAAAGVRELKSQDGADLVVLGSGALVRALLAEGLVDEVRLLIHPIVLGTGRRMFEEGLPLQRFRLADSMPTTTGVIIATYRPTDEEPAHPG